MQQEQTQQVFQITDLSGPEIEAIMVGLNELPAKTSRAVMNKVENQIIQQVRNQQANEAMQQARVAKNSKPVEAAEKTS